MKSTRLLALFALLSTAAGCHPATPTPPVVALRPIAVHACVAGASVWIDGAGVPTAYATPQAGDGNYPDLPVSVTAFNIHATAAGYPQYGAVVTTSGSAPAVWFFANCQAQTQPGVVVSVTPTWVPSAIPLPPAPSRDQIIAAQNWGMQGETWTDPTCTGGATVPLWDPIITPMTTACRLAAYQRKHDVYGDRKVIIPIAWGYLEPGTQLINTQGTDWTNDMPTVRARVLEAVEAGLYVDLNYAGDGASIVDTAGACAWQDLAPGYRDYGELCAEALVPLVDAALRGDGSTSTTGNLLPYLIKTIGWDGTFYGSATPDQVANWANVARASDSAAVLSMEFNVGHIPFGEGDADWQPGARVWNFDLIKAEFDPANQGYHDDATWQITDRLVCAAWVRPADMPAGDDPTPPCLPQATPPRGPWYIDDFENDTYCWVRLTCSIDDVVAHAQYMHAIGWSVIEAPLSVPSASATLSAVGYSLIWGPLTAAAPPSTPHRKAA